MSLNNYKITQANITQKGVVAAPDKLTGTAAENKAIFDRLIREVIMSDFNNVIDALAATSGASEIGFADITGVSAANVQAAIAVLKGIADTKAASSDVASSLALKADVADTNLHIKTVSFNDQTGVFTFTRQDGTSFTIDTLLEKIAVNFAFDPVTQKLVLTLQDGTVQYVDLSTFIHENDYVDSSTIDFTVSDHQVTASIKAGSITDEMLSSALVTLLQGYASTASTKAAEAAASAESARVYKVAAEDAKDKAVAAKEAAEQAKTDAETLLDADLAAAIAARDAAEDYSEDSQAYALGVRGESEVGPGDPAYENNAKYFAGVAENQAQVAQDAASEAVAHSVAFVSFTINPETGNLAMKNADALGTTEFLIDKHTGHLEVRI